MKKERKSVTKKRWRYFYMNDKLHKIYAINRGRDEVIAWCYPDREKVIYSWSAVKKYGYPGFRKAEVAAMLNRHPWSINRYLAYGYIPKPQATYVIPDGTNPGIYVWSKKDILKAYEYVSGIHKGWPRKDGFINAPGLPSIEELRAETDWGLKLYTVNKEGRMVRVWEAESDEIYGTDASLN